MIKIELAEITDLDRIMEITKACAIDLISKNIFQWNENYPSKEAFKKDIEKILCMSLKINTNYWMYFNLCR